MTTDALLQVDGHAPTPFLAGFFQGALQVFCHYFQDVSLVEWFHDWCTSFSPAISKSPALSHTRYNTQTRLTDATSIRYS